MDRITIQVPTKYLANIYYKVSENVTWRITSMKISISSVSPRNNKK